MKQLFVLTVLMTLNQTIKAQDIAYPEGMYMTFQEIIDKTPSEDFKVQLEKRTKGKIKMNGGTDFQINPINKNVKKKTLKKEVIAYSDGLNLYINGLVYQLQFWYSRVEAENDNYFVFKAGIPMNPARYGIESMNDYSIMFGGVIGGFGAAKRALIRLPYVLDKETKEPVLVSEKNINDFIDSNSDLYQAYSKEQNKDDIDLILKYLIMWINVSE